MSECTKTDKPLIAVLMAVYEPNMRWLKEQLQSLEAQTYPHLQLYIRDDRSSEKRFSEIQQCVKDTIHAFPYVIQRNEKNQGSNKTFERLTQEAEGEYFAYCDQDDIWLPQKLSILEAQMKSKKIQMVCSDVMIIDGNGKKTADSITQVRRRHKFLSGHETVFRSLLTRNFAIGCTMLIRRETARNAIPFLPEMVHDHWLAMNAAAYGQVISLPQKLILYRIHGGNQTGVLVGVSNRKEYIDIRIIDFQKRIQHIRERFPQSAYLDRVSRWAEARMDYAVYRKRGSAGRLWRLRSENQITTTFELCTLRLPDFLFRQALRLARKSG